MESATAFLKTQHSPPGQKVDWDTSLVCSVKEQGLKFKVCEARELLFDNLGESHLEFTDFEYCPEKDFEHVLKIRKHGKETGLLFLNIFFTERKNYLGDIEFYEFGSFNTVTTLRISDADKMEREKIPRERVIFYKGPCKSRNSFSCCDQDVEAEKKFEVVEEHYRDRR